MLASLRSQSVKLPKTNASFSLSLFDAVLFLVNYAGERQWWPIQRPNKERKKVKG